jgi:CPA2 family monovalent cation:H+ antiporter-2
MSLFRLLLALGFIIYILWAIYNAGIGITIGLAIFALIVFVLSKRVRKRMHNMETTFLNNLNERELRRSGKNNNLISDLHLAYMEVGNGCPFVGSRLMNSGLRQDYGISVVSIQRGATVMTVPSGKARIYPGDVIGVIGTDDQIDALLPIVESNEDVTSGAATNADMDFTSVQLTEASPLIGKTVATARIRDTYHALVVAIQRDETFITINDNSPFQPKDILWVVASRTDIAKMR